MLCLILILIVFAQLSDFVDNVVNTMIMQKEVAIDRSEKQAITNIHQNSSTPAVLAFKSIQLLTELAQVWPFNLSLQSFKITNKDNLLIEGNCYDLQSLKWFANNFLNKVSVVAPVHFKQKQDGISFTFQSKLSDDKR